VFRPRTSAPRTTSGPWIVVASHAPKSGIVIGVAAMSGARPRDGVEQLDQAQWRITGLLTRCFCHWLRSGLPDAVLILTGNLTSFHHPVGFCPNRRALGVPPFISGTAS